MVFRLLVPTLECVKFTMAGMAGQSSAPNFQASFFVPDCVPYNRGALGDATLSVS